jgi:hypothetical protein
MSVIFIDSSSSLTGNDGPALAALEQPPDA